MIEALKDPNFTKLKNMSRFCDGSAVPGVPKITLDICRETVDEFAMVEEGKVSTTVLQLYN
jgi:threonine dehydratase